MLIAAGIVGLIIPGPGTPALIAGGLALMALEPLASWSHGSNGIIRMVHHESMKQIGRFLDDLRKRYPYSRHETRDIDWIVHELTWSDAMLTSATSTTRI